MRIGSTGTIPVRIDFDLYKRVAIQAERNRRTMRAEIELLMVEALERRAEAKKLETRSKGGAS
jgi:hypothetical protein